MRLPFGSTVRANAFSSAAADTAWTSRQPGGAANVSSRRPPFFTQSYAISPPGTGSVTPQKARSTSVGRTVTVFFRWSTSTPRTLWTSSTAAYEAKPWLQLALVVSFSHSVPVRSAMYVK